MNYDKDLNSANPSIRKALAEHPNIPEHILRKLAYDRHFLVRREVARRPVIPDEFLRKFIKDKHYWVRTEAARKVVEIEDIRLLSRDSSSWVRSAIAANANTPLSILSTLKTDEEEFVRVSLVRNPVVPDSFLHEFLQAERSVKIEMARLERTPASVIVELATDVDAYVSKTASMHPNYSLGELMEQFSREV